MAEGVANLGGLLDVLDKFANVLEVCCLMIAYNLAVDLSERPKRVRQSLVKLLVPLRQMLGYGVLVEFCCGSKRKDRLTDSETF